MILVPLLRSFDSSGLIVKVPAATFGNMKGVEWTYKGEDYNATFGEDYQGVYDFAKTVGNETGAPDEVMQAIDQLPEIQESFMGSEEEVYSGSIKVFVGLLSSATIISSLF